MVASLGQSSESFWVALELWGAEGALLTTTEENHSNVQSMFVILDTKGPRASSICCLCPEDRYCGPTQTLFEQVLEPWGDISGNR